MFVETPFILKSQVALGLKITSHYQSKREYLVLKLAATRGLRPCEIFALRCNDVYTDYLMIDEAVVENILGEPKTPGSKARVVLTADLKQELEEYIQANGLSGDQFLFSYSTGKPLNQNNYVRRQLKTLGNKIGVPALNFRMLRTTFATHFKKHRDVKDLQSAMRHADATLSLEIYRKEITEETLKAVSSFEQEIMPLVKAA